MRENGTNAIKRMQGIDGTLNSTKRRTLDSPDASQGLYQARDKPGYQSAYAQGYQSGCVRGVVPDGQYDTRNSTDVGATCYVDHGIQDANDGGWTTVPAKHKNTLKNSPSNKKEG